MKSFMKNLGKENVPKKLSAFNLDDVIALLECKNASLVLKVSMVFGGCRTSELMLLFAGYKRVSG